MKKNLCNSDIYIKFVPYSKIFPHKNQNLWDPGNLTLLFIPLAAPGLETTVATLLREFEPIRHRDTGSSFCLFESRLTRLFNTLCYVGQREKQTLIGPGHEFAETWTLGPCHGQKCCTQNIAKHFSKISSISKWENFLPLPNEGWWKFPGFYTGRQTVLTYATCKRRVVISKHVISESLKFNNIKYT